MAKENIYYSYSTPVPDKRIFVWTRDESGRRTGEYDGYYKKSRGVIVLYPAKGSAIYGPLRKHEISDRLLRRATL